MLGAWKTWLQITCLMLCSKDKNENYNSRNLAETQGTQVPSCNPAVLGLNSGLKVNCAGGTTEGLLKFSTDIKINIRKNGEISVPKRSASLKRSWRRRKWAPCSPGSNAEPRLKVLRCWCRLSWMNTTKRDGASLLTNYLSWSELGVLYGKHRVPRDIHWTCSQNERVLLTSTDAHISLLKKQRKCEWGP